MESISYSPSIKYHVLNRCFYVQQTNIIYIFSQRIEINIAYFAVSRLTVVWNPIRAKDYGYCN